MQVARDKPLQAELKAVGGPLTDPNRFSRVRRRICSQTFYSSLKGTQGAGIQPAPRVLFLPREYVDTRLAMNQLAIELGFKPGKNGIVLRKKKDAEAFISLAKERNINCWVVEGTRYRVDGILSIEVL